MPSHKAPVNKNKEDYIRKTKVMEDFELVNVKERVNYFPEHTTFDKIYNECIVDSALELLENERY